ncbi:MAG: signal peptidase I [Flavobacteriales bacterium]|nr:signal peptidase I [Flavobacteriales bacterium]
MLAGISSWKSIIPFYNIIKLLEIIKRPKWWIIMVFIPVINLIMIPVIWVELSRSFKKNSYTDTFLSICTFGFYNYYLNYFETIEYVEDRDINPKSSNGEWTSSIIFAVIAATFVHTYFMQPYTIPTSSLEKSLLVGDFLFVSKFHYGARVPMTTIAAPMVHDTIPIIKTRSYLNKKQLPFLAELPYLRLPGFQKIKRNEIVCFNWPVDTFKNMYFTDKYYYKPIDKKTNYVKRAVGIAGDTLEVINGYVYINGEKNQLPKRAKLQFSYLVQPKKNKFNQKVMINNYDITDRFGPINSNYTYKFMGISDASLEKLKKDTNVEWIKKDTLPKGVKDPSVFPQKPSYNWNNDFFGPVYIPKKGTTIEINKDNIPIYERLIKIYENNDLYMLDSDVYINGIKTNQYTFKQDYYWLMGDNRSNSQDSRSWGFVPFDHVVGKPVFKWLSIDYNGKGFDKIRWDRMFTTVHGDGQPTSYFIHFIAIVLLWNIISYFRRKKLQ